MPVVLLAFGLLFLASAIAGTSGQLAALLKNDFTGQGSFLYWIAAVLIIGAVGYLPGGKRFSRAFLGLLLLSMFLANGGVFAQMQAAIARPPAPAAASDREQSSTSPGGGTGGSTGSTSGLAGIL